MKSKRLTYRPIKCILNTYQNMFCNLKQRSRYITLKGGRCCQQSRVSTDLHKDLVPLPVTMCLWLHWHPSCLSLGSTRWHWALQLTYPITCGKRARYKPPARQTCPIRHLLIQGGSGASYYIWECSYNGFCSHLASSCFMFNQADFLPSYTRSLCDVEGKEAPHFLSSI